VFQNPRSSKYTSALYAVEKQIKKRAKKERKRKAAKKNKEKKAKKRKRGTVVFKFACLWRVVA
jgi:hypothetical protein